MADKVAGIQVKLTARDAGFNRDMQRAGKSVRTFGRASVAVQGQVRALAGTIASVFAARAVARGGAAAVRAFGVQEEAVKSLQATLELTGRAGQDALGRLTAAAAALQKQTTAADEALISATGTLGNLAKELSVDDLEQAQRALIGIADTFLKGDVQNAALLLGKSIGSSTNALTRYGIQIQTSASQTEKLRQVMAQSGIFFDVAKAKANTLQGQVVQLSNAWGDLKESVGSVVVELLGFDKKVGGLKGAVVGLSESIDANRAQIVAWTKGFVALVKGGLLLALVAQLVKVRNAIIALRATTLGVWAADLALQFRAAAVGAGVARDMLRVMATRVALAATGFSVLTAAVVAGVWWFKRIGEEVGRALGPIRETREELENTARAITELSAAEVQALLTSKQAFVASLQSRQRELLYFLQQAKDGGAITFQLDGKTVTQNASQIRAALDDVTAALTTATGEAQSLFDQLSRVLSRDPLTAAGGAGGDAIAAVVPPGTRDFTRRQVGEITGDLEITIPVIPEILVSDEEIRVNAARLDAWFGDTVGQWAGGAEQEMYGIGQNLVSSMIRGTESMASSIARAALAIGSHFFPPLKIALGIFSPSKPMRVIGQQLGAGLVLGIQDTFGQVAASAHALAGAALPTVQQFPAQSPAFSDVQTGGNLTARIQTDDTSSYPPWALDWLARANIELRYAGEGV